MSFFNSLQQYVTSSVANLSLGTKRFSLSKEGSSENADEFAATTSGTTPGRSASTGSVTSGLGFPKVVPSSVIATPTRRKTVEYPNRSVSFPQRQLRVQGSRPPAYFCVRAPSWPEIDLEATSNVHEMDGSFFENYVNLYEKLHQKRTAAFLESIDEDPPPCDTVVGIKPPPTYKIQFAEMEQLYIEVLYTIKYKVGSTSGQSSHHQDELYAYAQRAFRVSGEMHRRYMNIACEEKPPIVVLNVVVIEAESLEAKDVNGFSDPYCMLGIQPGNSLSPPSLSPGQTPTHSSRGTNSRAMSEGGSEYLDSKNDHEKLRKHHSFRLSFKRKDRREHRDSISSALPAKFIRATSVKPQTLNPRWKEKFRFDIDDVETDILHLDIWDHDDETSVLDSVSKLNEVRGVKGLGRFFKQIAQSARSGNQDDFLGCINIPIRDIPAGGVEAWFRLEGRTHRSNIQGRIKLKLWLSKREDRGTSEEEDIWSLLQLQERLYTVFVNYEMSQKPGGWSGELSQAARNILYHHAAQGELSDLQQAVIQWITYSRVPGMDPKTLLTRLNKLEGVWGRETLSREEEEWLADSFNAFLDYTLQFIRKHRKLFPIKHAPSMLRLEYFLKCLGALATMKAFWKCCPFNKEVRGEVTTALRKGAVDFYDEKTKLMPLARGDPELRIKGLVKLFTTILIDLQRAIEYYNALFENHAGVQYFATTYKQLEKQLATKEMKRLAESIEITNNLEAEITILCRELRASELNTQTVTIPENMELGYTIFELYFVVQKFASMQEHLSNKTLGILCYYHWFEPAMHKWMDLARFKAHQRIRHAIKMNSVCNGDQIVKHTTSVIDVIRCFNHMKDFWRDIAWPDVIGSYHLTLKLRDAICECSQYYIQLTTKKLREMGYYDDQGPYKITDEMCCTLNDLEYVRRMLCALPQELKLSKLLDAMESMDIENAEYRSTMYSLIDATRNEIEAEILLIISKIGIKMRPALKKAMFHLAWSPDSLPTTEAISPLLEYLETHLLALNLELFSRNFDKVLLVVWEATLYELSNQTDCSVGDKLEGFYDRLHEALDMLVAFFNSDDRGMTEEALCGELYQNVKNKIQYHKTDTENLFVLYYIDRLKEQSLVRSAEYGVLSVRAYFHHDALCIEILNARDVIPLDPNGFSDPFVIVELLPRSVFAHCPEQITNVQKKTLNPFFDECFEFYVTLEQCQHEGSMILFTVMDHDVITANDFAGEAFLSLASLPGVDSICSIESFNGIKPVDLPLMFQKNKHHPILQILEARTGDKQAQDFVKKQKPRIASS